MKEFKNIIIALIIAAAAIACTTIFITGITQYKSSANSGGITATGSASCDFESDLIVWRGSFSVHGETLSDAYAIIKKDAEAVKKYLLDNQISELETTFHSVNISQAYTSRYDESGNYVGDEPSGYNLSQTIVINSTDIDKVEMISRDISALIETGIRLESYSPEYYCTKLDEVKLDLIKEATDNAQKRVQIMADNSGAQLGKLLNANLGVFQIIPRNSGTDSYSYDGTLDTSARYKTAVITVKLNYETN